MTAAAPKRGPGRPDDGEMKGRVFRVLIPEFRVSCAADGCDAVEVVTSPGEESDLAVAQDIFVRGTGEYTPGWTWRDGRAYCPEHEGGGR